MTFFSHKTEIINQGAQIGKGSEIGHWVHICADAFIERKNEYRKTMVSEGQCVCYQTGELHSLSGCKLVSSKNEN